jgi:DNA modification methylase
VTVSILVGDVRAVLPTLPSDHFDCVVTSVPYWGLRDYGVAGQIGLEPTLGEHIAVMVDVFREVRRVLKPLGTCWLNYGDCYAASPNGRKAADIIGDDRTFRDKPFDTTGPILANWDRKSERKDGHNMANGEGRAIGVPNHRVMSGGYLKPKDLAMVPNRVAIALQDDGWWVRSEIIWHKPNPMPESVTDRPTSSHEKIWLLTKRANYWYDAEAIAEPHATPQEARAYKHGVQAMRGQEAIRPRGNLEPCDDPATRYYRPGGRNARNVWTIATSPFPESHFATFPPELPERCLKAGCPPGGRCLDPFGGAGTVGLVADRLGLDCTLIELNESYAAMAESRIRRDAPLFVSVATHPQAAE